jgi:hypothetical protein
MIAKRFKVGASAEAYEFTLTLTKGGATTHPDRAVKSRPPAKTAANMFGFILGPYLRMATIVKCYAATLL